MPRKHHSRTDDGTVERTVVRTVERTDDGTGDEPEVSAQELETYENVERIRAELGDSEGYVLLSRRLPNGTLATLAKINASIFDVEYIIKKYGGGTYSARFFKSGVAINNGGFLGSVPFIIDPSVQPEPESPEPRAGADVAPTWIAATLDKMGQAIKALADRKPEPPPPAPDPMAMIRAIGETMKSLTPAAAPPPPAPTSLKDQIDMIKSVVEVGTSIIDARGESGGGSSGDAYMGAITKLADPIVELVKTRAQQEQARLTGPRRPALPPAQSPATGHVPPQLEPARQETHVNWLLEIQRWLPLIVKRQQKGLSAESTAFFVLDELSEQTLVALAEFLTKPDAETQLQQVLPVELRNNPAWLSEFLTAVRDYLFAEEDDDADQDAVPPAGPTKIIDLEEEAAKRLGKLRDKPPETEGQAPEQPPA